MNQYLDIIIKATTIVIFVFIIYIYTRIQLLDQQIERIDNEFERERDGKRGQGRGQTQAFIDAEISRLEKSREERVAPLERERQRLRLLTKIPFLK